MLLLHLVDGRLLVDKSQRGSIRPASFEADGL